MTDPREERPEGGEHSLASLFEQCVGSVRRLASYAQQAQREGNFDVGELLRRAQAEIRERPARGTGTGRPEEPAAPAPKPAAPTHDQIARRAFEIHEREQGDAAENWLRAERELREESSRPPESG